MRVLRVGTGALLVEVADVAQAMALYREARRREVAAVDVVPGARTVLFDGVADVDGLAGQVGTWSPPPVEEDPQAAPEEVAVEVPTVYDGPDLEAVARLWQVSPREVVEVHTSTPMVVAFCGFAPGFAYCAGLDPALRVPRHDTPRTRVPAGSVGLADTFTGVYPTASPGGWQLIGRTDLVLWDASREQPATLAPGTRVRFVEVTG